MKGNCLIVQSGGPTTVINHSLYRIFERAFQSPKIRRVFGAKGGIYGSLNQNIIDLTYISEKQLSNLRNMPGAALGSRRFKISEEDIDISLPV